MKFDFIFIILDYDANCCLLIVYFININSCILCLNKKCECHEMKKLYKV